MSPICSIPGWKKPLIYTKTPLQEAFEGEGGSVLYEYKMRLRKHDFPDPVVTLPFPVMRLQGSFFFAAFLAVCAGALPALSSDDLIVVDPDIDFSVLPESGQVVFTPQDNTPSVISADDLDIFAVNINSATEAMVADWKTEVVRQHNAYRAHYGAPPLTWSDALYPGTQQWANQCKFQHSNGKGAYGENLVRGQCIYPRM